MTWHFEHICPHCDYIVINCIAAFIPVMKYLIFQNNIIFILQGEPKLNSKIIWLATLNTYALIVTTNRELKDDWNVTLKIFTQTIHQTVLAPRETWEGLKSSDVNSVILLLQKRQVIICCIATVITKGIRGGHSWVLQNVQDIETCLKNHCLWDICIIRRKS